MRTIESENLVNIDDNTLEVLAEPKGDEIGFQIKYKTCEINGIPEYAYLKDWVWKEKNTSGETVGATLILSREKAQMLLDSLLDALDEKDRIYEEKRAVLSMDDMEKGALIKEISQLNAVIDDLLDAIKWLRAK